MVMEESVLPRRLTPCITGQGGRAGSHCLVNIRACGSPGDFVEHQYVLFPLVPGTVLQAEKLLSYMHMVFCT